MSFFKPTLGTYSIADDLSQRLLRRWVPKWYTAFHDPKTFLFYERLGHSFKPLLTGKRRLLSQFRQLAMYAHAAIQPESLFFRPDLEKHFAAIAKSYAARGREGAWIFSLDDSGAVADDTLDLYSHAFVIFALSRYWQATNDVAATHAARSTIDFINNDFRQGVTKGFVEALDKEGNPLMQPRRHESHMHLLEACLFAYDAWQDATYMSIADEIVDMFFTHFYDTEKNLLSEYFTNDLVAAPDAQKCQIICEPGHYYEWVWLLKKHASLKGTPAIYDAVCLSMLDWANTKGWDGTHGGIFDELSVDGAIIADTKRLWPFTEGLKANALMLNLVPDRDAAKDHMVGMVKLFRDSYMQERGFWTEWLNRDLSASVDYMPATTPYHVYFGIVETREILKKRGASKSWRAGPRRFAYALARFLSAMVREMRRKLLKNQVI